jgi:hypothetical protein
MQMPRALGMTMRLTAANANRGVDGVTVLRRYKTSYSES